MSVFFWPADGSRARSNALTPWASSLLIPVWSSGFAWVLANPITNTLSLAAVSGVPNGLAPSSNGYVDCATDGISGAWLLQYAGTLQNYTSGGSIINYPLPATGIFTGLAYSPAQNHIYAINASGQIYTTSGAGVVLVGSIAPTGSPYWTLTASGSTLFTLQGANQVGVFSLSATGAGASGQVSPPASGLLCLAASSPASAWAAGGFIYQKIGRAHV